MRSPLAVFFALASSALAYQVLSPNSSVGWTDEGPQLVKWSRVDTDAQNFTVVLDNQSMNPRVTFVLAALVDGTQTPPEVRVDPPSGGWPRATGFRVNLVRDTNNINAIYAQSDQFEIRAPNTSASSSSGRPTTSSSFVIAPTNTGIAPTTNPTPTGGSEDDDSGAMISFASIGLTSIFAFAALLLA